MDGNSFSALIEKVKKREAILSSRNSNDDPISILDQTKTVDRLSHQTPNLFFQVVPHTEN